jgi:hypothetical protein
MDREQTLRSVYAFILCIDRDIASKHAILGFYLRSHFCATYATLSMSVLLLAQWGDASGCAGANTVYEYASGLLYQDTWFFMTVVTYFKVLHFFVLVIVNLVNKRFLFSQHRTISC